MQLYKTTAMINSDDGLTSTTKTAWSGSMAAAGGDRASFIAEGARRKDVETTPVDIPTNKTELLNFLNGGGL